MGVGYEAVVYRWLGGGGWVPCERWAVLHQVIFAVVAIPCVQSFVWGHDHSRRSVIIASMFVKQCVCTCLILFDMGYCLVCVH
jgi:hypothetical protein